MCRVRLLKLDSKHDTAITIFTLFLFLVAQRIVVLPVVTANSGGATNGWPAALAGSIVRPSAHACHSIYRSRLYAHHNKTSRLFLHHRVTISRMSSYLLAFLSSYSHTAAVSAAATAAVAYHTRKPLAALLQLPRLLFLLLYTGEIVSVHRRVPLPCVPSLCNEC